MFRQGRFDHLAGQKFFVLIVEPLHLTYWLYFNSEGRSQLVFQVACHFAIMPLLSVLIVPRTHLRPDLRAVQFPPQTPWE